MNYLSESLSEPHGLYDLGPAYNWKLPELGIFNINFLIADVTYVVSGTITTFSQVGLAVCSIYDRHALLAKGSGKSEEFKHFNGFFSYFLLGYNEQDLF